MNFDLYKIFYKWVKDGNKKDNYDGFLKYLLNEYEKLKKRFKIYEEKISESYAIIDNDSFTKRVESLSRYKDE